MSRFGRKKSVAIATAAVLTSLTIVLVAESAADQKTTTAGAAATNRMMSSRASSCAVTLNDGRVLITGGETGNTVLSTTELFSVRTGASAGPSMSTARSEHACTTLSDGRVLVAGGWTADRTVLNTVEIFNPTSGVWTPSGILTSPRAGATASLLKSGKVLIAGGETPGGVLGSVEVFDPSTGKADSAPLPLITKRSQHAAAVLVNGKVLIAGGTDGTNALDSLELYDPSTSVFTSAGKLSEPRASLTATTLLDGRIYLAGGIVGKRESAAAEIYNPKDGSLTPVAGMGSPRSKHLALRLPENNAILIIGGKGNGQMVAGTELFIPWMGKYKPLASVKIAQSSPNLAALVRAALSDTVVSAGTNDPSVFPVLTTDKNDYSPGETATITGTGWPVGSTVSLHLERDPNHTGLAPKHWDVIVPAKNADGTDNTDGSFTTTYDVVEGDRGEMFTLTGYVGGTMETAQIKALVTFTDGSLEYSPANVNLSADAGTTVSFVQQVTAPKDSGSFTASMLVAGTGMPSTWVTTSPASLNFTMPNETKSWTVSIAVPSGTTTGSYSTQIKANPSITGVGGASGTAVTLTVTSAIRATTLTVSPATGTYGGTTTLQATLLSNSKPVSGKSVSFTLNAAAVQSSTTDASGVATITGVALTGINAGTYATAVGASFAGDRDYSGSSSTALLKIDPATPVVIAIGNTCTYNGKVCSGSGTATGVNGVALYPAVTLSYSGTGTTVYGPSATAPTNAGDYSVTASFAGNQNYDNGTSAPAVVTIGRAAVTATAGSYTGKYDASAHSVSACVVSGSYTVGLSCSNSPASVGPDAGSGTVTPVVNTDPNFVVTPVNGSWTIDPAEPVVTATGNNCTYNGQACNGTGAATGINGATLTPVTLTYTGTGYGPTNAAPVNAGDYTVVASFVGNQNYTSGTSDPAAVTIAKAAVTATAGSYTGTYDGSSHGVAACVLTGSYTGNLTCTNTPASVGPDAGSGTIKPNVTGDLSNFNVTPVDGAWKINPATPTVTATGNTCTYNGQPCTGTGTATGVKGEALTPVALSYAGTGTTAYGPSPTAPTNAGDYTVTASFAGNGNYTSATSTAVYKIVKAPVTATAGSYTGTYDGATHTPTACAVSGPYTGGLSCSNDATSVGPNAGTGTVKPTVNGDTSNFEVTLADGTWTINRAPTTVTVTCPGSVVYNGSAQTLCSATATGAGNLNQQLTVSYTANVNAGPVTASASYGGDQNHTSNTASTTFNIDKAPSVVTLNCPASVIYNQSSQTPCTATVSGAGGLVGVLQASYTNNTNPGTASASAGYPGDANHYSDSQTITFLIVNVAPKVTITAPISGYVVAVGTPVKFEGTSTDAMGDVPKSAIWTFDTINSAVQTPIAQNAAGESYLSVTQTFTAAGVYKVSLKVTDGADASTTATKVGELDALVVVYDPNAGFVTGGGWIDSQLGSCTGAFAICGKDATGKANFGFVSKYLKGANKPTGETEFQFKAGNLNFNSTSYDVLVVSGPMAQYRGTGTINGTGTYKFILTARDGQVSGGGGVDGFRIRILDSTSTTTIYDNLIGASDIDVTSGTDAKNANVQILGGGSISIKSN